MKKKPSLMINAVSSWANLGVTVVITFFLTPFIISHIGKTGYGIWTLVASFAGYYGLLNLGVSSAITRYIAKYSGSGDNDSLNKIASTALVMFTCTGLIVIIVSFLIVDPLVSFFKVLPDDTVAFKNVIKILGIATGLSFPASVFSSVVTATERFVHVNILHIFIALLRAGLTIFMLNLGMGLSGVAYATLIIAILTFAANTMLCWLVVPNVSFNPVFSRWSMLVSLLAYGGVTTIITLADMLRTSIDSVVISKFVSLDKVGVYGVAALIIRYIVRLIIAGMGVLTPRFANLHGCNDREKIKSLFTRAIFASSYLAGGAGVGVILLGPSFIKLWLGSDFDEASTILLILIFAWITDLAQNPSIGLMFAMKKHHLYAGLIIVEAIANLALSIYLAPVYGVIGVAIGTVIPMILIRVFVQPFCVIKIIEIGLGEYIKTFKLPFFSMFLVIFIAYIAKPFMCWAGLNYINLAIVGASAGLLYVAIIRILSMFIVTDFKAEGLLRFLIGKPYVRTK